MRINAEKVHEMCQIQSNINTRASLMTAYPMQTGDGNVRVGKRFVNLPADIDMTPGSFYIMCVVDVSRNDKKPVIGQCCFMVEENGELVKSSFCRIDYAYRAVYRTHKASDVLQAHREADAILSWEESMPQEIRLEYLYTTLKNPSFDAYKWKVTTRDIINGRDAGQVDNLRNLWIQLNTRQGKSEALVNWLNNNPLVTPNTNKVYVSKSSFQRQQPQQVPQQPDYQRMRVRKFPNGFPRHYQSNRQNVRQNPPMANPTWGPSAANGAYAGGDAACWVAAASDGGICPSNGPKCGMATANDVPSVWHGSSATESPSVWMVATAVCRWFWTCLSAAPCECLWATTNRPECDCRGL